MTPPLQVPDSARLKFRLMDSSDAPLWFELDQDPEVMRYLNDSKPTTWEELNEHLIPRINKFTDPAAGCGLWEVARKADGAYLGWILVRQYGFDTPYHEPDNIEFGWRLKRHCWGQGIATEAARAILERLRDNPAIRVFSSLAVSENLASIVVMRKLGMRFVDIRIHQTPMRNYSVEYYEMPARLSGSSR
jgi:RimJ/RimL family protein N-acetyltransferase